MNDLRSRASAVGEQQPGWRHDISPRTDCVGVAHSGRRRVRRAQATGPNTGPKPGAEATGYEFAAEDPGRKRGPNWSVMPRRESGQSRELAASRTACAVVRLRLLLGHESEARRPPIHLANGMPMGTPAQEWVFHWCIRSERCAGCATATRRYLGSYVPQAELFSSAGRGGLRVRDRVGLLESGKTSTLKRATAAGRGDTPPDGLTPTDADDRWRCG